MYRELTTKRVAIVLALELAIMIALGVLYDIDTQKPDVAPPPPLLLNAPEEAGNSTFKS